MTVSRQFEHVPEAHGQGTLFDVPQWKEAPLFGRRLPVGPPKAQTDFPGREGEIQQELRDKFRHTVTEGRPAIQIHHETMESMARDEPRYKSQYETGHSSGYLDPVTDRSWDSDDTYFGARLGEAGPGLRSQYEKREFGIPTEGMHPQHRPVYGFIHHEDAPAHVESYGEATAILKPHVRDRTTVTYGDSLGADEYGRRPSRLQDVAEGRDKGAIEIGGSPSYYEAQYHGGIRTRDIDHIELEHGDWRGTTHAEDMGVPWRMVSHQTLGRQPSLFTDEDFGDNPNFRDMQHWRMGEEARIIEREVKKGTPAEKAIYQARYSPEAPRTISHGYQLSRQFTSHASPGFTSEYDIKH
jgi:hypothetical protein